MFVSAAAAFAVERAPWRRWPMCVVFCCLSLIVQCPAHAQDISGQPAGNSQGSIRGTVVDQNGNFLLAARVSLTHPGQSEEKTQESDGSGQFVFTAVPSGPFQLTV